jgi:addiction module RelE/StbE family toxin
MNGNGLTVKLHKDFEKQLAKLPAKRRDKVIAAIDLFVDNPREQSLRNHVLSGEWTGYRSIRAGGDLRLHFKMIDGRTAYFVAVGTHSQLYK